MKIQTSEQNIAAGCFQNCNFLNVLELFMGWNCNMSLDSGSFLRDSYFYFNSPYSSFPHSPLSYALLFPAISLFLTTSHNSAFLMNAWSNSASHISQKGSCSAPEFIITVGWQNEGTTQLNLTVNIFFIYPLIHLLTVHTHCQAPGNSCMDRKHDLSFSCLKAESWKYCRSTGIYEDLAVGSLHFGRG